MVSKVAVMALVAIIAVPILVGFGTNFEEVQSTQFVRSADTTNVTPLLQSATEYEYAAANSYETNVPKNLTYPLWYQEKGASYTSFYEYQYFEDDSAAYVNTEYVLSGYDSIDIVSYGLQIRYGFYDASNQSFAQNIYHLEYDGTTIKFDGTDISNIKPPYMGDIVKIKVEAVGGSGWEGAIITYTTASMTPAEAASNSAFVNLAGGFRTQSWNSNMTAFDMPAPAKEVLITIDLSSVSPNSLTLAQRDAFRIDQYYFLLDSTTNPGYWTIRYAVGSDPLSTLDTIPVLNDSESVYQIKITPSDVTVYYVGTWPNSFGAANVYKTYGPYTIIPKESADSDFTTLKIFASRQTSPYNCISHKMRIDSAMVRSATYSIIQNRTYDPATLMDNPYTKLETAYTGSSLTFGGNTYTISNGTINMGGTHPVPVNGMILDSVPTDSGYDNRINGTVISTTATPSTITFIGKWAANITTGTMSSETVTENKWIAGGFAWDGFDSNFMMVGLLTAVGAFILLAMYGKKSGAKVGGLMLVCGGAALMFLVML